MSAWRRTAICLLLAAALLLGGCSGQDGNVVDALSDKIRSWGQRQPNTGTLSVHHLVQKIADAIKNDGTIDQVYESIPDKQRDGLTLDQFQQYIRFLRRGVSGQVTSFSEMAQDELDQVRDEIADQLPEQPEDLGGLTGFWIHYQEIGRRESTFAVYVRSVEGQAPDLFAAWVRKVLDLADLATLYFDALERSDGEALAVLLATQPYPDDILDLRAQRLIGFYRNNITSQAKDFRLTQARMDRIGFEEFGIINPDQSQAVSRNIELLCQPDGRFLVEDVVPEVVQPDDLVVFYQGKNLFQLGQVEGDETVQVRSDDLESIIGAPERHDDTVCKTAANGVSHLSLTYRPLSLRAEGTCFRHSRWSGVITDVNLFDKICSTGSGLSPGDSVEALLLQYPFAREAGYVIRGSSEAGPVRIRFNISGEIIDSIELTVG